MLTVVQNRWQMRIFCSTISLPSDRVIDTLGTPKANNHELDHPPSDSNVWRGILNWQLNIENGAQLRTSEFRLVL